MKYSVTQFPVTRLTLPCGTEKHFVTSVFQLRQYRSCCINCMLHFTLATVRLQEGSAEIRDIAFCDEWNLALTGLKVIYVGQRLTAADCLHVGSASEII